MSSINLSSGGCFLVNDVRRVRFGRWVFWGAQGFDAVARRFFNLSVRVGLGWVVFCLFVENFCSGCFWSPFCFLVLWAVFLTNVYCTVADSRHSRVLLIYIMMVQKDSSELPD